MAVTNLNYTFVSLPPAWDAGQISQARLADNASYADFIKDVDDALTLSNRELLSGFAGQLVFTTDEAALEYPTGRSAAYERATERGRGTGRRAEMSGHMLPLVDFDYPMDWTRRFLKNARRSMLDRQVNALIERNRDLVEKLIFERLFKLEEETGDYYGLGTSGYSVPFADGGNGTIAFTPPPNPDRQTADFASSHTHFLRLDGITQANLETAVKHLWEHGHDGPFELIISMADIASWTNATNVTGFTEKAISGITYGNAADLAQVEDWYIGGVKTEYGFVKMFATGRVPTAYYAVTRAYGPNDMRNPLALRYPTGREFGAALVADEMGAYPLQGAIAEFEIGCGVGYDRTAAVAVENDSSGSYASPTIS